MADKHLAFSRAKPITIPYVFDGGGSAITGNPFGFFPVGFAGYVLNAELASDGIPALVEVDIQTCTLADYPSGLASIVGSTPPSLEGVEKMKDSLLTGWIREFVADTVFKFIVNNTDTVTFIAIALNVIRF